MNKPSSPPADAAIDQQAADRLEEAFARHQDELLGTLYYLIGDAEEAQDALQEAFVKCWRSLDKIPEIDNLRAWIFRVALNTGRDLRKTAWRRKRQSLPGDGTMLRSKQAGPAEAAELDEELARLRAAVLELRPEEKEVFLMRQNGELTYDEIAAAVGIPTGTAKTRMRLALTKLREALAH